jgi:hypothetical protein
VLLAARVRDFLCIYFFISRAVASYGQVLRSPPPTAPIVNSTGTLDPPLGQNRLKILEVIHSLVSLRSAEVEAKMIGIHHIPPTNTTHTHSTHARTNTGLQKHASFQSVRERERGRKRERERERERDAN